jgi:Fe2+ transport system protein B
MKQQEIQKIKDLDKDGLSGTVQSVLLNPDINQAHYAEVLYYLLVKTLEEKNYLERVGTNMTRVMQSVGLIYELNKCLELEEKV